MNRWIRHGQLAQLEPFFARAKTHCADYFRPFKMVLLDGVEPIDAEDKATALFFYLVRFNPKAKRADLETFKDRIHECLREQVQSPTAEYEKNIARFFKCRTVGEGWANLDRIFHHMIGVTLSHVVDSSHILFNEDDQSLNQPEFYTLMLRVRRVEETTMFHEIRWAAVASDLDRILNLAQEVADNHIALLNSSRKRDNRSSNGDVIQGESERWAPCAMDVLKNAQRIMSAPMSKSTDEGSYAVDWAQVRLIRPSQAVISSILGVAPSRAGNLLKGRYLEDELGI